MSWNWIQTKQKLNTEYRRILSWWGEQWIQCWGFSSSERYFILNIGHVQSLGLLLDPVIQLDIHMGWGGVSGFSQLCVVSWFILSCWLTTFSCFLVSCFYWPLRFKLGCGSHSTTNFNVKNKTKRIYSWNTNPKSTWNAKHFRRPTSLNGAPVCILA